MTEKDILLMIKNKEIELYTASGVAKDLNCTRQNAHTLLKLGKIPGFFIGGVWFTFKGLVKDYKKNGSEKDKELEKKYRHIRELKKQGYSVQEIAKMYNHSTVHIYKILRDG